VRPAVTANYGVQRSQNGGAAMRAIAMLPCITGSWAEVGRGLQLSTSGAFYLNMHALDRPDLMQKSPLGRAARVVNMSELGKALNTLSDPPVKAIFVYNSNPAVVALNHHDVIRVMRQVTGSRNGPRAVFYRYHQLRRYPARYHVPGERSEQGVWPHLSSDIEPVH
jgi:anaerobic selenocysteine-containing dehydrogenase